MRFVIGSEAEAAGGGYSPERYREMLEQAQFAEEMGFSAFLTSEQHFNPAISMTSAPEVILGYLAAKTSTMRLRVASFPLLTFNHPLKVAEKAATLDVVSNGRVEIGTARSNNPRTLKAFEVDPSKTRQMWFESMEILRKALTLDEIEHEGEFWTITPPVVLRPRPVQQPHPPIFVSATSVETHRNAGKLGIGVMTGNSLSGGWPYLEEALANYQEGLEEADPGPGGVVNKSAGAAAVVAHCAATKEQAHAEAEARAYRFLEEIAGWFAELAASSPEYAYMASLRERLKDKAGLEEIIEQSPYISIGTPDFFIERAKRLEELGYDEFLLCFDGLPHEQIMSCIELIGKHVIPAFAENTVAAGALA
jgi:alkanesulfonate monooxygenase SsuD/methylene tetrahydromethanopterin reductase-like flavin-dependent oxidoreductase (luciferase family)